MKVIILRKKLSPDRLITEGILIETFVTDCFVVFYKCTEVQVSAYVFKLCNVYSMCPLSALLHNFFERPCSSRSMFI